MEQWSSGAKGTPERGFRIRDPQDCAATRLAHAIAAVPALSKEKDVLSRMDAIYWFIR
jgi:hypothetical protein